MEFLDTSTHTTRATLGSVCADVTTESDLTSEIMADAEPMNRGRIADFQLDRLLGRGKYSQVFLGRDVKTNQLVAIKRVEIFDMMDSATRLACLKEVKILQNVEHPNIVKCFKYFIQDNELVIVLEWAEAGDLANTIKERQDSGGQHFSTEQVVSMFHQVCSALKHMHDRRMMHRDLKPSNIFCTSSGDLKLGDLGLSRYFSSRTLQAQTTVGTPYYMSPECIKGQPYDFSSDIWSLGCLLYEMIALRNPFYKENQSLYVLGKAIQNCTYEPLPASVPEGLRNLVTSMLQPAPQSRPTIGQVHDYVAQQVQQQAREQQQQQERQQQAAQQQQQAMALQQLQAAMLQQQQLQAHATAAAAAVAPQGFGGLGLDLGVTGFGIQMTGRGANTALPRATSTTLPR